MSTGERIRWPMSVRVTQVENGYLVQEQEFHEHYARPPGSSLGDRTWVATSPEMLGLLIHNIACESTRPKTIPSEDER